MRRDDQRDGEMYKENRPQCDRGTSCPSACIRARWSIGGGGLTANNAVRLCARGRGRWRAKARRALSDGVSRAEAEDGERPREAVHAPALAASSQSLPFGMFT